MNKQLSNFRPSQMPLRWRLTLWYTLALGILLTLFSAFLYLQIRESLLSQVDSALQLTVSQALINIDDDGGLLAFQNEENNPGAIQNVDDDFVIHLVSQDGTIWDSLSSDNQAPSFDIQVNGYQTLNVFGDPWRIYTQTVTVGETTGQIQIAQDLEPINSTLENFQRRILFALPIALILAAVGGFFLASRALRPIDQITQTAQSISASELNKRIGYQGPADEVGRLAHTFDTMLNRLQSAFERERRFTGDAAHELRTPLTALKGRIDVTLRQSRQPDVYAETLVEMEDQVDRLIRLSSDLLLISRLDQVQFKQKYETIDLDDFIGAMVDLVRPLAEAKTITLIEFVPSELTISGNIDLLIRLLLNLLDNAVKHTPNNGVITIEAQQDRTTIKVSVINTGPGISADHLPHLFERFYRVDTNRARNDQDNGHSGAGLGLAIAHEIARAHNGTLTVQSEIDQVTQFTFEYPIAAEF